MLSFFLPVCVTFRKHARHLTVFLALLVPSHLWAQVDSASISGSVVDKTDASIPEATVRAHNTATGTDRTSSTNRAGSFNLPGLTPGRYELTISKQGFSETKLQDIVLNVGDQKSVQIRLKVGSTTEIVVDSSAMTMNTTDATVGTVIDRKFVENIPLNGRSFQDLISLTPGVVTQSPQSKSSLAANGDFSVNGQRTESNYYTVDGVTANIGSGNGSGSPQGAGPSGSLGGSTALGTTQSLVSVDALQEFRVQSSSYSAEYGRSPGGQFSLVTRSGTKSIHGSIYDYLRNNFFDANDWFNDYYGKPTPALRQNDFGGTLGGPILFPRLYSGKDRTFFFISYEGLRLTQPQAAAIQYVPDICMRQRAPTALQPILNAFPLPNGVDYGMCTPTSTNPNLAQFIAAYSLPSSIDSTSVRIDQTFNPKVSGFFRYGNTPSSAAARTYFALVGTHIDTQTFTFGTNSQVGSNLNNEFRLGYNRVNSTSVGALDAFGGATPTNVAMAVGAAASQPLIGLSVTGIGTSYLSNGRGGNIGRQWNLLDTFSVSFRRHEIRLGFDYRHIKTSASTADPLIEGLFQSAQSVLANSADYLIIQRRIPSTPLFNETAAFVQDDWRVSQRLSVASGLRWEVNPPPTGEHGNDAYTLSGDISNPTTLALAPRGVPLWKTTWYNFAPRFGAVWSANTTPGWETAVRAGGGVFLDTNNVVATAGFFGLGFTAQHNFNKVPLPATAAQLDFLPSTTPPYGIVYAFPSHLQLPYTLEWNVSAEQALSRSQTLTLSYVASNGRRLPGEQEYSLASLNHNFTTVVYFPAALTSNYQALQARFQRSVTRGVQALVSYTWSHSLDFGSTGTALPLSRGNSDFDIRSNFQSGVSWDIRAVSGRRADVLLFEGWGLDSRLIARTGFPVTLGGLNITDTATGSIYPGGVNLITGRPVYLYGSQYPGGRAINGGPSASSPAFTAAAGTNPGNAPRNFVRGFGAWQVNLAVRREFELTDKLKWQFRAETFNVLNHPNFGYVDSTLSDVTFGRATQMLNQSLGTVASQYQQGGPRSMQFALKMLF